MGEFCSLPPITLKPRPSSVLGSSTTRGWEWPSLAAKAATVACWGGGGAAGGGGAVHRQCTEVSSGTSACTRTSSDKAQLDGASHGSALEVHVPNVESAASRNVNHSRRSEKVTGDVRVVR